MSAPPAAAAGGPPKPSGSLDIDFHESTHSRIMQKAMSTRRLVTNRHDDLLRSGSTHQLLNRPFAPASTGATLSTMPEGPPVVSGPPGAAASLATENTAEESDSEESDFSGGSFCDAAGDCKADKEYLRKDLGASLHDDDLDIESGDDLDLDKDDDDDGLISDIKNRMKLEEEKEAS